MKIYLVLFINLQIINFAKFFKGMKDMNKRQRLDTVFAGGRPDRPPVLGGWIASPDLLIKITGRAVQDYNSNPEKVALDAYKKLEMDGLIDIFVTKSADAYRNIDHDNYLKADIGLTYEEAEKAVECLPAPEEYEKGFDFEKEYSDFRERLIETQAKCGDLVYMPAQFGAGAVASWYGVYGYENFFLLTGLRPDLAAKLFQIGGVTGRCRSRLVAAAVKEGVYPKAVLLGEDICTQRGPMISVRFLEEHYAPALSYGLEPLLEVGCRPVWHSDGDVRKLLPMLLSCGIEGFQGFQPECGMLIEDMIKLRTRNSGKLLIFGPLAVTTELPVFSPEEIRRRVRYVADICKDEADLVFMTSNTINPDIPLENLLAMYDEIRIC